MNKLSSKTESQNIADWLLRLDLLYRTAVHIIESVRKNKITDTDTISLINTYFTTTKRLIDLLFSDGQVPAKSLINDKINLDSLGEYTSNKKYWGKDRLKINSLLMDGREILHGIESTKNKALEEEYIKRLITPVNIIIAKYLVEKSASKNTAMYELTYNSLPPELKLNGVVFAKPKESAANEFYENVFSNSSTTKKATLSHLAPLNTSSMINNLGIPRKLRSFMFTSTDESKGMIIRTVVTANDIQNYNIDVEEVENFLATKRV